jgi:hypothetical protein
VLRSDLTPARGGTEARARMLREAQAMARLRHPNVVTVFEVGEHDGQLFLAMEYVSGGTLAAFADAHRNRPGGWRTIVDAYARAGRGLVAAHESGLVHRDFKPANVLVEGDRVQVTDFGIASLGAEPSGGTDVSGSGPAAVDPVLTQPGTAIGTAAYMAPEQHRGESADERSDQFAFCVSLFEALHGVRPFSAKSPAALALAVIAGKRDPKPARAGVPEWVERALDRGLATDPGDRWPSMKALVDALASPDRADVGRKTRSFIGAILGVGFVGMPLCSALFGVPSQFDDYEGTLAVSVCFLLLFAALTIWARASMLATAFNRRVVAGLATSLSLGIPLQLGHWATGLPVRESHIMHLLYWSAMATMFALLVEPWLFVAGATYLVAYAAALQWPGHHIVISAAGNAGFLATVMILWFHPPKSVRDRQERQA